MLYDIFYVLLQYLCLLISLIAKLTLLVYERLYIDNLYM